MPKCILVTGASKGLGLECARILLEKFQCNVVTLSRSSTKELQDLKGKYAERLDIVQGDVSNEADQQVRLKGMPRLYGGVAEADSDRKPSTRLQANMDSWMDWS